MRAFKPALFGFLGGFFLSHAFISFGQKKEFFGFATNRDSDFLLLYFEVKVDLVARAGDISQAGEPWFVDPLFHGHKKPPSSSPSLEYCRYVFVRPTYQMP